MNLVPVVTATLTGPRLDWAVGVAVHDEALPANPAGWKFGEYWLIPGREEYGGLDQWNPSEDWALGGPLIERVGVILSPVANPKNPLKMAWCAQIYTGKGRMIYDIQPLVAVCRAIVAARYGDTVGIPLELIEC